MCKKQSHYSPGQALGAPGRWGSQSFYKIGTWRWFVSPTHRSPLPPCDITGIPVCLRLTWPQDHSAAGRIKSMKNPNDPTGNRTSSLLAFGAVPQPIALQAVPWLRRLVAGLSLRRPGFDPGSVHVRFCGGQSDTVTGFSPNCRFFPVNFIPLVLHYL
jgi:hypothetical protein